MESLSKNCQVHQGDCQSIIPTLPENSIDTIITDPPYGLGEILDIQGLLESWILEGKHGEEHVGKGGFMQRKWDACVPPPAIWKEAYRVLKPGGLCLVFAGTRTFDLMGISLRLAGFEIRDTLLWLYGQGWPKGIDICKAIDKQAGVEPKVIGVKNNTYDGANRDPSKHKSPAELSNIGEWGFNKTPHGLPLTEPVTSNAKPWKGWNSTLKPSYEPIIVCQKPLDGSYANNAVKWGVAGYNIDGCRLAINPEVDDPRLGGKGSWSSDKAAKNVYEGGYGGERISSHSGGRWPPNVVMDDEAAGILDEQSGVLKSGTGAVKKKTSIGYQASAFGKESRKVGTPNVEYGDKGGASRFFNQYDSRICYEPKAKRSEREKGMEQSAEGGKSANSHPTIKPLKLMQFLVRLTKTPTGGIVLDPFMGSGTTGMACVSEKRDFIGIELEKEYYEIAKKRIEYTLNSSIEKPKQKSMF